MLRIKVKKALRDIVLDVDIAADAEETLVLMGSNGSGKSTLLNLTAGLAVPDKGVIEADGKTLFDSHRDINVPPEERKVGFVFQNYALFPHLSVFDNVAFGLKMRKRPRDEIEQIVRGELELVDMWGLGDARADMLSSGQRQKVALARALAIRPSLLLLDEPLSSMDAGSCASIRERLKARIRRDRITTVLVTHSMRDALELGDRVCVLDFGKVILSGAPTKILEYKVLF